MMFLCTQLCYFDHSDFQIYVKDDTFRNPCAKNYLQLAVCFLQPTHRTRGQGQPYYGEEFKFLVHSFSQLCDDISIAE